MNNPLLMLLTLSLSGSLLALILLAINPLIKNRVSQTWQYYIWLIVILRFLLPFTPQVSVMGEMAQHFQNITALPANVEVNPGINKNQDNITPAIPQVLNAPQTEPTPQEAEVERAAQTVYWRNILNCVWMLWLGAALVLFANKIVSYGNFVRFVKVGAKEIIDTHILSIYEAELAAAKIKRRLPLYINEQVISPMLIGSFRPSIVIPALTVSDDELRHVFRHELTHYKRLDFLYKWTVQIAVCLHWFNPLLYLINKEINRFCELSCDENVIKHLDVESRVIYGDALIASLKAKGSFTNFVLSITMSENADLIKERLDMMMKYRKKSGLVICVTVLLTTLLFCGFAFTGAYAANGNKNAQSNEPISTLNTNKEVENFPDNYKQIVKTLDGSNIENISIHARMCRIVLEKAAGDTFEAVFSYPEALAPHFDKYFDLNMGHSGSTINIATDYDDFRDSFDEKDSSETLVIRIPQKKYHNINLELDGLENSELDVWMETNGLEIESGLNHLTMTIPHTAEVLRVQKNLGDMNLVLNALSPNTSIDNLLGDIKISLPEDPQNIKLNLNNVKHFDYSLPANWNTTVKYETVIYENEPVKGETVTYESGNKSNRINATNVGLFVIETRKDLNGNNKFSNSASAYNQSSKAEKPMTYTDINSLSFVKRNVKYMNTDDDYFSVGRIDVVDNNGYDHQALIVVCQGSDRYTKQYNQFLEKLKAAYPKEYGYIVSYSDASDDEKSYRKMDIEFFAIQNVTITADGFEKDATIIAVDGSDSFEEKSDRLFDEFFDAYYEP